jgi:hypothetical protein
MSDAEYEERQGTLRSWVKDQQQADPTFTLQKHAQEHHDLQSAVRRYKMGLELPEGFKVQVGNFGWNQVERDGIRGCRQVQG